MILFREWYCLFFFFFLSPLFCAHELRTSGGTLTLFIFIEPLSVCARKKEKKNYATTHPTHMHKHARRGAHIFFGSRGKETRRPICRLYTSPSLPDSPLMCSRKCHHASRKEGFFFLLNPPPPPPTHTHTRTHPPTSHMSKTICCRSLIPAAISNAPFPTHRRRPTPFSKPNPKQTTYQFPPLSGSRLPVSVMTFPASLCCPTDALSTTNGQKKK